MMAPSGEIPYMYASTHELPPPRRTDPCPFLVPPGARLGVGLLGMVPGSLRLPLSDDP